MAGELLERVIIGARGAAFLLLSVAALPVVAQKTETQFLPEIDAHYELNSNARLFVQAKDDRDGGDPEQFTLGPSILFYRKPLMRLKRVLVFDLDTTKSRPLVFESGYRAITATDTDVKNRMVEAATFHYPLVNRLLLTDRNRFDLDWQSGNFGWRYRNKLTLEREFGVRSLHFSPYAAAEAFYESQYGKWASTDLYAGSAFPIGKHADLNLYYEHENDTGKNPNRQKHYVGSQLQVYFSRKYRAAK